MKVLGVIPARLGSTRLPRKPLALLRGRPLVAHVWLAAGRARRLDRVVVATDAEEVAGAARAAGAEVVLTDPGHRTGTERAAEVARRLPAYGLVVNIQGDEPLLRASDLDAAVEALLADGEAAASTLAHSEMDPELWRDRNVVKVTVNARGYAETFFRLADGGPPAAGSGFLRHVGLYAYRRDDLLSFAGWPPSEGERREGLEQLRLLEHGRKMRVVVTPHRSFGVDTAEDLAALEANWDRLSVALADDAHTPSSPELPG